MLRNFGLADNPAAANQAQAQGCLARYQAALRDAETARAQAEQEKRREDERRQKAKQAQSTIPTVINGMLEEQKKGQTGEQYWVTGSSVSTMFAVRSWEIVNTVDLGTSVSVKVRVDSSNKGGIPISVLWTVHLTYVDNVGWRVWMFEEAQ